MATAAISFTMEISTSGSTNLVNLMDSASISGLTVARTRAAFRMAKNKGRENGSGGLRLMVAKRATLMRVNTLTTRSTVLGTSCGKVETLTQVITKMTNVAVTVSCGGQTAAFTWEYGIGVSSLESE